MSAKATTVVGSTVPSRAALPLAAVKVPDPSFCPSQTEQPQSLTSCSMQGRGHAAAGCVCAYRRFEPVDGYNPQLVVRSASAKSATIVVADVEIEITCASNKRRRHRACEQQADFGVGDFVVTRWRYRAWRTVSIDVSKCRGICISGSTRRASSRRCEHPRPVVLRVTRSKQWTALTSCGMRGMRGMRDDSGGGMRLHGCRQFEPIDRTTHNSFAAAPPPEDP